MGRYEGVERGHVAPHEEPVVPPPCNCRPSLTWLTRCRTKGYCEHSALVELITGLHHAPHKFYNQLINRSINQQTKKRVRCLINSKAATVRNNFKMYASLYSLQYPAQEE